MSNLTETDECTSSWTLNNSGEFLSSFKGQSALYKFESMDTNRIKMFVRRAIQYMLDGWNASILRNGSEWCVFFVVAVFPVVDTSTTAEAKAKKFPETRS